MNITTVNPATGQLIKTYPTMSLDTIDDIVKKTHLAYQQWRHSDFNTRKQQLLKLATLLEKRAEDFARIITLEMGKPITQARAEVAKCVKHCIYYAEHGESFLAPRDIKTAYAQSYVCYEPTGIIFAIMPWNFPLWQVLRFLAPCLMTGNAAILSHAPISTGCGLMVEALVQDAGYPENLFRSVIITNDTAAYIIRCPEISGVTLTGSERAGSAVASEAGAALKRVVLELGGSDPYLILEDANLQQAAKICVQSRLLNAGQVCISAKRLIALEPIHAAFTEYVIAEAQSFSPGNPFDETCTMGPMARADLRQQLHQQVQDSIAKGAQLICGGTMPEGPGFYYPVTILTHVKPGMPAYDEELFGPVISILQANDEKEAITIANQLRFGLGAAVFTEDLARGERIARVELEAGTCAINTLVTSNSALPFGGVKASGFGREQSAEGIREFCNVKTIYR